MRFSVLVSAGVLLSHALFAYAQYSGKDHDCVLGVHGTKECPDTQLGNGLLKGKVSASFDFDAAGALAEVTRLATEELCYTKGRMEPCPDGPRTQVMPSMGLNDDVCTALECEGLTFGHVAMDLSYWCVGPRRRAANPPARQSTRAAAAVGAPITRERE